MRKCVSEAPPINNTPSFAPVRASHALFVSFGSALTSSNLLFALSAFDWRMEITTFTP
jgi:hypothetical protein